MPNSRLRDQALQRRFAGIQPPGTKVSKKAKKQANKGVGLSKLEKTVSEVSPLLKR